MNICLIFQLGTLTWFIPGDQYFKNYKIENLNFSLQESNELAVLIGIILR